MLRDLQISPEIRQKFESWWNQDNAGRPLMHMCVRREDVPPMPDVRSFFQSPEDYYLNAQALVQYYTRFLESHTFRADGFMDYRVNLGPGSMALYVGAEPEFRWESLWYHEIGESRFDQLLDTPLTLDTEWVRRHTELIESIRTLTDHRAFIPLPDIVESVDTLAALRGAQNLCYDFIDEEEKMAAYIEKMDAYYLEVYDHFYQLVSQETGGSGYAGFKVWGQGKVAKMQCDFCALMNPRQFQQFVLPSMQKECKAFDKPFYHLDGVDAIKHLPFLLQIDELKAIQWTNGAGKPDGLWEGWYEPIYDKVMDAGKSLYILVDDHPASDSIEGIGKLIRRYGTKSLFIRFLDELSEKTAEEILIAVDRMSH